MQFACYSNNTWQMLTNIKVARWRPYQALKWNYTGFATISQ